MLRIGMDMRSLETKHKSGVANYIEQLALDVPNAAPDIKFSFFFDAHTSLLKALSHRQKNVQIIWFPFRSEKKFMSAVRMLQRRFDLFHFPSGMIPENFKTKAVINVYDLIYEHYPQFYSEHSLMLQKTKVRASAKRADGIITISESTKKDLVELYGIEPGKIVITFPLIFKHLGKNGNHTNTVKGPFLLAVGEIQPRKNFVNLVKAIGGLKNKEISLVIVGRTTDSAEKIRLTDTIKSLRLDGRITLPGFIPEDELMRLFDCAEALVFPSFYEGFGIPILEAFSHDLPVVTSDTSSMPEAAGDAGVYINPDSPDSIREGIEKILDNPKLKADMIKKGRERLRMFEKNNLAKETVLFYRQILNVGEAT